MGELKKQIENILSQMSLTEKIEILTGIDDVYTKNMPQYNIESKAMVDGPHGVRLDFDKNCTHFPNPCIRRAYPSAILQRDVAEYFKRYIGTPYGFSYGELCTCFCRAFLL